MTPTQKAAAVASSAARAFLAFALSAVLWVVLLLVGGVGLLVGGVFILAGQGWAMVTAGFLIIVAVLFVGKGMSNA